MSMDYDKHVRDAYVHVGLARSHYTAAKSRHVLALRRLGHSIVIQGLFLFIFACVAFLSLPFPDWYRGLTGSLCLFASLRGLPLVVELRDAANASNLAFDEFTARLQAARSLVAR